MIRLSSGARQLLATELGLAPMFGYGHIKIYSGPAPMTPDAAATGTLLGIVSKGGIMPTNANYTSSGLTFAAGPTSGSIVDTGDWQLTVVNPGYAGWWRLSSVYELVTPDADPMTIARIDGVMTDSFVGLTSLNLMPGPAELIRAFVLSVPSHSGA